MRIRVERFAADHTSTVSVIFVGAARFFGLEDEFRAVKIPGETRIPAGTYRVKLRREGQVHANYSERFAAFHRGMLWLQDVPGFVWIYFHTGNTEKHTEGCILVGYGADLAPGAMTLRASEVAYRAFYERVAPAAEAGELEVEIVDRDRSSST